MTTNNEQQGGQENEAVLPDVKTAYDQVFDGVHCDVFFTRLGQVHGIVPQTEKEAHDLLLLAGRLRNVETEKAADDQSRYGEALSALDSVLGENNMDGHLKAAQAREEEFAIKQAAAAYAEDPMIYNSILSLKAHEADVLAGSA